MHVILFFVESITAQVSIPLPFFIKLFLFLSLLLSCSLQARVVLENDSRHIEISNEMQVYTPNEELSIDLFRSRQPRLLYQEYQYPNIGFQEHSVWMFTRLENKSDFKKWFVNVNFTQLPHVDAYLYRGNELIYASKAGNKDNQNHYRLPTFELELETDLTYGLYLRVKAERIPIIAPIFISDASTHAYRTSVDSMVWGAFYGGLFILALYALSVVYAKRELSAAILFLQVCLVSLWQLVWSGHAQLLPQSLRVLPIFNNMDFLIPFLSATTTLFVVSFLKEHLSKGFHKSLISGLLLVIVATTFIVGTEQVSSESLALLSRFAGFLTIACNAYICFLGVQARYKPAYPIVFGIGILFVCAIVSSLFVAGFLPPVTFNTYVFQFALVILTCSFASALNSKLRYALEIEVIEASRDAENNFLLIEEQNVHLDIARKEAIRASEVKSQFLANMSHEIRTPLNAIVGFSKELETNINQAEREEYIRIINASASDLLTIVNDILDFSKMEAGKLKLCSAPFSAYEIFEDIATLQAKSAHLKQLDFVLDLKPLPSTLLGDQFKLKQLLSNLLSNALKFTNYGVITLRVNYELVTNCTANLSIEVQDTGIGISEQDREKLFKPFNQLNDELNRSFQGTGLGLVICQELTYLMNGSIDVESTASKGSIFKLNLPFEVLEERHTPQKMPFWETKQACIFDPNPLTRSASLQTLSALGITAYSYELLETLLKHEETYDLAFITLQMKDIENWTNIINKAYQIKADQFVLLYSGPSPETYQYNQQAKKAVLLRLPITTKKLEEIYATPTNLSTSSALNKFNKLPVAKVLAVDDMPINLKLLETWLKNTPISFSSANSGEQAVKMSRENEYDIILMDIQMPNMDGVQASKLIRKTPLNQGTPIIAITAHAFQEEKQHFLDSGMDDYLPKPIEVSKLVALINEWCPSETPDPLASCSIDWALSVERSYGNERAAFEYLDAFIEELSRKLNELERLWESQDIIELKAAIHQLHGGCCYAGVPDLQNICHELETQLKRQRLQSLAKAMSTLLLEMERVIEDWKKLRDTLSLTN